VTEIVLPLVFIALLALLLFAFLKALDREQLRRHPLGLVSPRGAVAAVAGGFGLGLFYGLLTGWGEGLGLALLRAVTVGLIGACAGAFYLGTQQRAQRRRQPEAEAGPESDEIRDEAAKLDVDDTRREEHGRDPCSDANGGEG
jgi:hypothetical protein